MILSVNMLIYERNLFHFVSLPGFLYFRIGKQYILSMKPGLLTTILIISVLSFASAQQKELPPAIPGQVYGEKVQEKGALDIAGLPAILSGNGNRKETKLKARVVDVCPKKGCWMNLYINDSTTAFVKMKDYGFFVPQDIKDKTIVIEGEAYIEETSIEELRHYAEDAKKTKEEIEAIVAPEKSIRITASGIKVLN